MDQRAIELHDQALGLMPEGASHDESECPICVASKGGADEQSNDSASSEAETQEGTMSGANTDTLSKETHDALLRSAVEDATAALRQDNEALTAQVESLTSERDEASAKVTTLEGEVARLNTELDTAQVEVQTANEKVTELETEVAERDEREKVREVAAERAKQVKNLGLFSEDAIDEKAERWAALSEEDWAERLEEWKAIKPTAEGANEGEEASKKASSETASAMSGTSEGQEEASESKQPSARRAVLGLPAAKSA